MSTNIDKKWSINELSDVDLKGDLDVTNFGATVIYMLIVILVTFEVSPFYNSLMPIPKFLINYNNPYFNAFVEYCSQHYSFILFIEIIFAVIALIKLTFNRNFILYNMLYNWLLKIKIITIEDNLSPFNKLIIEFEKIIWGINKNNNSQEDINLQDKIIFFWIRKDKDKSRKHSIEQLVPFLSLIVILFTLKEKSYKLVVAIGAYYAIIGLLYVTFITYIIQILKIWHIDIATLSVITMFTFIIWYILTIYNAFKLVDIDRYIKTINKSARRAYIKEGFNFSKAYSSILDIFDRDNAIYIYDNTTDKYQQVDSNFLQTNLRLSKKFIDKSIGTLITAIISILLVVFVEISANGVFGALDKNSTKGYSKVLIPQNINSIKGCDKAPILQNKTLQLKERKNVSSSN